MIERIINLKKRILSLIIKYLASVEYQWEKSDETKLGYSSLSPVTNADPKGNYRKALIWALYNRKSQNIRNIAITGSYGSGKSSILKTFQKNYKGTDLKFLNISLATFTVTDEENNPQKTEHEKTSELLKLIEISILEQIFYHEEDKFVPDSRFKKIRHYSRAKLWLDAFLYLIFLLAAINVLFSSNVDKILETFKISDSLKKSIYISSVFVFIIGIFLLILKSIRLINSIRISSVKFQNAEVGVSENLNKSILNHHIDELLYFFTVRPYNVVIFEDLDRFKKTEIFTKLRELNLLLNNSKKTEAKAITFIYAVGDEIFANIERTKFFDFILPVISIINSSNSREVLIVKNQQFKYNLTDSFIENISFFIDDMRVLHNVTNEFYAYQETLDSNLNRDKLFAIITYKNIYPKDFYLLVKNDGELFKLLKEKSTYVESTIQIIKSEISQIQSRIQVLNSIGLNNIQELRMLYVARPFINVSDFISYSIAYQNIPPEQIATDNYFHLLRNDTIEYNNLRGYSNHTKVLSKTKTFKTIENEVDSTKSYAEREEEINDKSSGKIEELKHTIVRLEEKIDNIKNLKIAEILKENNLTLSIKSLNENFVKIILKNGYIAEDYLDYVSLFHEGSITVTDYKFILSVKNELKLPSDYVLNKIQKVVERLNETDFDSEFILNFQVVDFLLINSSSPQAKRVLLQLSNGSQTSLKFVDNFFDITKNLALFTRLICHAWEDLWRRYSGTEYTSEKQSKVFKSIINYAEVDDLPVLFNKTDAKKRILANQDFLNITTDEEQLKNIIKLLDIKFEDLNFEKSPKSLLEFIYKNNFYLINIKMLYNWIRIFGKSEELFYSANYTALLRSELPDLLQYVDENLSQYFEHVYLKITENTQEHREGYILLLNNEKVNFETKKKIIEQVNTKVINLKTIHDTSLYKPLLTFSKVLCDWRNIHYIINLSKDELLYILNSLVEFISKPDNIIELSHSPMMPGGIITDDEKDVIKSMLTNKALSLDAFSLFVSVVKQPFKSLEIETLTTAKMTELIRSNSLEPNEANFLAVKQNFPDLIDAYLHKNINFYIANNLNLEIDSASLSTIIQSSVLNDEAKQFFLNSYYTNALDISPDNVHLVAKIVQNNPSFRINSTILDELVLNEKVSLEDRIILFVYGYENREEEIANLFVKDIKHFYSYNKRDEKVVMERDELDKQLLERLAMLKAGSKFDWKSGNLNPFKKSKD